MKPELKPEPVRKPGQRWTRAFLDQLPIEKRLEGLSPQEVTSLFTPQEVISLFTLQERLMGLTFQDVFSLFTPQEWLMGLKPQEILDQFDPKQIEEYLEQLQRKKG